MSLRPWDELQLRFELPGLDEVDEDAQERQITPEQARMISEAARVALEKGDATGAHVASFEHPGWFEDYLLLIGQGWPWRVAAYMAWASVPKIGREPKTLKELAEKVLGLTGPRVINNWRRKYPSIETIVSMMQSKALWEHRSDVLTTLAEMAAQPDYKSFNDRKLFLEMIGDYTPKSRLQVSGTAKDLSELSDADLDRLIGNELTIETQNEDEGEK
jgi:hypothetical protein